MTLLLDTINYPADLKKLSKNELPQLVEEIRICFMQNIAQSGGHFASNLGTIELTVALHYVFNTPNDHLIWDVGHQAYVHKLLTGRKNRMHTIRQYQGLAPFPKTSESEYDSLGVGHSSTSISAGLGMAIADQLDGKQNHTIVVIGDGAMTAGMAFEGLNNAGDRNNINFLVILNDNEMSISNNVGFISKHLARSFIQDVKGFLQNFKMKTTPVLEKIPLAINTAQQIESKVSEVMHNTRSGLSLFNNFGFHYTGVINGHDVLQLVEVLEYLKQEKGPQLLHINTKKGHGFTPAEHDPIGFHAIGTFDSKAPPVAAKASNEITFSKIFGDWVIDQAQKDPLLIAITPAMREGSSLVKFEQIFPERYFDVGIAEQHAVTFAAGLALAGKKPVVAIYSTFLQRAYDQLIHDVALQNLPVLFAIDRAGVVGEDGPTHIGAYDISFLRCIPNMLVATPSDELECRLLLSTCYQHNTPSAVRYPRGNGIGTAVPNTLDTVTIGQGVIKREGQKIAILAFGPILHRATTTAESLNATLVDMRFVKPLDETLILQLAQNHDYLITLEENAVQGGAGSAVLEVLAQHRIMLPTLTLGIPDLVTEHGNVDIILHHLGLDTEGITHRIEQFIKTEK